MSVQAVQTDQVRAQTVADQINAGTLSMENWHWFIEHPEYFRQVRTEQPVSAKPTLMDPMVAVGLQREQAARNQRQTMDPMVSVGIYREQEAERQQKDSETFWTGQGYPQYVGCPVPQDVSEAIVKGGRIVSIEETLVSGLSKDFMGPPAPSEMVKGLTITYAQSTQEQPKLDAVQEWLGEPAGPFAGAFLLHVPVPFTPKSALRLPLTRGEALMAYSIVGVALVAPEVLPAELGITTGSLVTAAVVSVGISEVISLVTTQKPLPLEMVPYVALAGEGFAIGGTAVMVGVGKVAPMIVSSPFGRAGVNAALGGALGYGLSGGNPQAALEGAAFGGAFSLASDYILIPAKEEIKARLPSWFLGSTKRLELGEPTLGKTGEEVPTWISEPQESLGGEKLRIVGDVTEMPVGVEGTTLEDIVREYVGRTVPTGHATLKPEAFILSKGGETLLMGFSEESAGFRSTKELFHFYSAPGSEEFVTVYGGYMGIGGEYSEGSPKLIFGGKATALVTTEETIADFGKLPRESVDEWLARISLRSGETGIAPETLGGQSLERQLITPAAYEREGVNLPGSKFVAEENVGKFQIKQLPEGLAARIPVIRSMLSKYTDVDVVLGRFEPIEGVKSSSPSKVLNVSKYTGSSPANISVPSIPLLSLSTFLFSTSKSAASSRSARVVSGKSVSVSPISYDQLSISSKPSVPSFPSVPSTFSKPSKPSIPSIPSIPSMPSSPSFPSKPSRPSYPSPHPYPSKLSLLDYPSDFDRKPLRKTRIFGQWSGLYIWQFPILDVGLFGAKKKKGKR